MSFTRTFLFITLIISITHLTLCAPSKSISTDPILNVVDTVNEQICGSLKAYDSQTSGLASACEKAHLATNIHVIPRSLLNGVANVNVDAFVNVFDLCNGVTSILSNLMGTVSSTTASLFGHLIVPTLLQLVKQLNDAVRILGHVVACTDDAVAATVYGAFKVFSALQQKILTYLSANVATLVKLNLGKDIHDALVSLDTSLEAYLKALFTYISSDLDTLNLRASLMASVKTAIAVYA